MTTTLGLSGTAKRSEANKMTPDRTSTVVKRACLLLSKVSAPDLIVIVV